MGPQLKLALDRKQGADWLVSTVHTRARRVQNMGWTPDNKLWLATRGGDVFFGDASTEKFDQAKLGSRGFGILDVGCVPPAINLACIVLTSVHSNEGTEQVLSRNRA